MTQIFFPPSSEIKQQKLYCYVNQLTKVVIAKIKGLKDRNCERVVFPSEKFLFTADDDCKLEIYQQTDTEIIKNVIACSELLVLEKQAQPGF